MPKATSGEWSRYYEDADRRRQVVPDPLEQHYERAEAREKRYFLSASGLLVAAVIAFCALLVR